MSKKPTSAPSMGPRAVKKQTSFPSSGASTTKKDSTNVHDSRRDNSKPKAWGRRIKGHQDQKDAVKQGGSVN